MSDPRPSPEPGSELEVDVTAFLPEGTRVGELDGADEPWSAEPGPEPVDGEPEAARPEPVDVEALTRIEGELAEVDAALLAIDAGDLARSALLVALLAGDEAPGPPAP